MAGQQLCEAKTLLPGYFSTARRLPFQGVGRPIDVWFFESILAGASSNKNKSMRKKQRQNDKTEKKHRMRKKPKTKGHKKYKRTSKNKTKGQRNTDMIAHFSCPLENCGYNCVPHCGATL
jgi:hypothetical protein